MITEQQLDDLLDGVVHIAARFTLGLKAGMPPNQLLTTMNKKLAPSRQELVKRIVDACVEELKEFDEWQNERKSDDK